MLELTKLQVTKNELTYRRNYGKIAALITYVCSSVVERRQDMMGNQHFLVLIKIILDKREKNHIFIKVNCFE